MPEHTSALKTPPAQVTTIPRRKESIQLPSFATTLPRSDSVRKTSPLYGTSFCKPNPYNLFHIEVVMRKSRYNKRLHQYISIIHPRWHTRCTFTRKKESAYDAGYSDCPDKTITEALSEDL